MEKDIDIFQTAKCIRYEKDEKEKAQKEELDQWNAKFIKMYDVTRMSVFESIEKINGLQTSHGLVNVTEERVEKDLITRYLISIGMKKFCYIQIYIDSEYIENSEKKYSKVNQVVYFWPTDSPCLHSWTSRHFYECKRKSEQYEVSPSQIHGLLKSVATHFSEWL